MKEDEATIFDRKFDVHPIAMDSLRELQETGCITCCFLFGDDEENGTWWRIRLTPREIVRFVDAHMNYDEPMHPELEALVCGHRPWRYERVPDGSAPAYSSRRETNVEPERQEYLAAVEGLPGEDLS